MKTFVLTIALIILNATPSICMQGPETFAKGMFGVTNPVTNFKPGTQEFGDALGSLRNGNTNQYTAISLVQHYQYFNVSNSGGRTFYKNLLRQADSVGIKVLIDARFHWADYDPSTDTRDGIISLTDISRYKSNIQWILSNTNTNAIGGWYISDEPENSAISAIELKKLYDTIKNEVPSNVNDVVFIAQGADFESSSLVPPGNKDYSIYINAWDVLIVGWYGYSTNNENSNIDNPNNYWRQEAFQTNGPEGTLRGWNYIQQKLKTDIGFPGGLPSGKKVYANLVLGEEVPEGTPNGRDYYTYQSNLVATHGITHAAIEKIYDMGFSGVFFYDYLSSNSANPNEFREDAVYHWTENEQYAEAIETEIYDNDWLVTAVSSSNGGLNRVYLSARGSNQSPVAGYNETFGGTVINDLSAGDLWGEENSDFTYVINTNQNRKSIADGDDELVYTTSNKNFWISEENHVNSLFGNTLNSNQSASYNEIITAMATGDFDGDGDAEVVTSTYSVSNFSGYYYITSSLYMSNDAINFKQNILKTYVSYSPFPFSVPRFTSLITGDFEGIGRDKLITATWNVDESDLYIYLSDIAVGESPVESSNAILTNLNSSMYVSDFAVGDFDGDFREELATAFVTQSGDYSQLTISKPKIGGGVGNPGHGSNRVWYSPVFYETVTAVAAGDFKNERKDYLITALWNSSTNTTNIYQSRPSFDSSGYGNGDPTDTSDPETENIYQNGTYWHVTSMTAGSFRESLPSGSSSKIVSDFDNKTLETPSEFSLSQNYPNPFNPTTEINYSIPSKTPVQINVYDIQGRLVSELVKDVKSPGTYSVTFNASGLSSGVYIYTIITDNFRQSKKLTLIK